VLNRIVPPAVAVRNRGSTLVHPGRRGTAIAYSRRPEDFPDETVDLVYRDLASSVLEAASSPRSWRPSKIELENLTTPANHRIEQ
jgi:hypothetical protein